MTTNQTDSDGWISVEDRLPESGQKIIAIGDNGEALVGTFYDGLFVASSLVVTALSIVTHWHPLPALPQGADNE